MSAVTELTSNVWAEPTDRQRKRADRRRHGFGYRHVFVVGILLAGYLLGMFTMRTSWDVLVPYTILFGILMYVLSRYVLWSKQFEHPLQATSLILLMEHFLSPIGMLALQEYEPDFMLGQQQPDLMIRNAMWLTIIGMLALLFGERFGAARYKDPALERAKPARRLSKWVVPLFSALAIAAVLWKLWLFAQLGVVQDFANRRILLAGTGYLDLLTIFGTVASLLLVYRSYVLPTKKVRNMVKAVLIALVASVSYAVVGQRGAAVYALVFVVVTRATMSKTETGIFAFVPLSVPLLILVDRVTSEIRAAVASGGMALLGSGQSEPLVPTTFSHLELLGTVLALEDRGSALEPNTLFPSFFNWLPRILFPDKPLTTGPTIASILSPDVINQQGLHNSSYTTGPFLEFYWNGGIPLLILGSVVLGYLLGRLAAWYRDRPHNPFVVVFFVYQSYLLGWNIWLDDLGGAINKQVQFMAVLGLMWVMYRKVRKTPSLPSELPER